MKVLIILSCLAVLCHALPSKRHLTGNVAKTIKITADMVNRNDVSKRASSKLQAAFDLTDVNKDGHISAVEFATYYVNSKPLVGFTMGDWMTGFNTVLKQIDSNHNGTLEINEYEKLMVGYGA